MKGTIESVGATGIKKTFDFLFYNYISNNTFKHTFK